MSKNMSSAIDELKVIVGDTDKEVAGETAKAITKGLKENPGVAVNNADNGRVSPKLVKEETQMLNNNPRNNDM